MWESIINGITKVNDFLNNIVWGWPAIILILGAGIVLSIRTKFLQLRKFGDSWKTTIIPTIKSLGKKKEADKGAISISQFEAFSAAISGTVGTGNIVGVVTAIITGGPGAVFWMWVCAFFGMVTNYSENILGLYYRTKDKQGNFSGGSFYYIANGAKLKWLGYLAALFCMLAAIGMSGVQTNTIAGALSSSIGSLTPSVNENTLKLILGIVVAFFTGLIIIGGIKRIGKVTSMLVPLMSLLFMILSIIMILIHVDHLPQALGMIFKYAFQFKAAAGGIFGYTFMVIVRKGMARGVFSNEAGLGSSVIAHSASETREPVKQGLWGVFEVFFDTFIICTLTSLMFLTTMDVKAFTGEENGTLMALEMFSHNYGTFGTIAFSIILPLFAFTTIVAWSYYGEKATEFFFQWLGEKGRKIAVMIFKVLFILLIIFAAVTNTSLAWAISDTANGLMAIPNLIGLIILSGTVVKLTKNYYDRKNGKKIEPMLSAYPDMNEEFKKDIMEGSDEKR